MKIALKKKIVKNSKKLKTILIGFGDFASGYPKDRKMQKYFKYCSHAEVLSSHESFEWDAVVDPNYTRRNLAKKKWKVPIVVDNVKNLPSTYEVDVAIISSPPDTRLKILESIKVNKGLLLEKPVAENFKDALKIKKICKKKRLKTQINFFRRINKTNIIFKTKLLNKIIGDMQCGFCVYGKGLKNNAIHYIDLARMIFGEVIYLRSLTKYPKRKKISLFDNFSFILGFKNKKEINFSYINYNFFREVYFDIWGSKGRLEFLLEGIKIRYSSLKKHRAVSNYKELSLDNGKYINPYLGNEYYEIYTNLANCINKKEKLVSDLENAITNEYIIDRIIYSSKNNNKLVNM